MSEVKQIFKSTVLQKRWFELKEEKDDLVSKKSTKAIQDKIDLIGSLMTSCKIGFNLSEAKVKKITKFMKEHTGIEKVKYGTLPTGLTPKAALFKEFVIQYVEKDGQIIFREFETK